MKSPSSARPGGRSDIKNAVSALRRVVADHIFPDRPVWVRVRRGIASGRWLRLNLARERHWWSGNHEPAVQARLCDCIHSGMVFYDIGAHIGFFSLAAAQRGARVCAFEADPENADRLRNHVERNNFLSNIAIVEAAVWSEPSAKITFQRGLPRSQGGVASQGVEPVLATGPVIEVSCITIDEFVASGGPPPNVIKIDVEGGEAEVLKGAAVSIERYHPQMIVEIHRDEALRATEEFLRHVSYVAEWRIPPEGFPRQCFAVPCEN
jgi:FkbM family methyltransferase